jgi:FkbM family methyltransferase
MAPEFIRQIQNRPNAKREILASMKRATRPLVLYGAGGYAKGLVAFLQGIGIPVAAAAVDHEFRRTSAWEGLELLAVEDLPARFGSFNALIGFADFRRARERLRHLPGCRKIFFLDSSLATDFFDYAYVERHQAAFQATYARLADDLSRSTMVAYVNAKISGVPEDLYDCVVPDQYFPEGVVSLTDREIFVDAGAYDGDTLGQFIRRTSGRYRRVFALEPDPTSFRRLSTLVAEKNWPQISLIPKGAWRSAGTLKFQVNESQGSRSSISSEGSESIAVTAIDQVVNADGATFVKMDIEGAELAALEGAEQTIRKFKPKLAVCAYHKPEDLIAIPQYLDAIAPGYSFYLRHHLYITQELVLYAVMRGA